MRRRLRVLAACVLALWAASAAPARGPEQDGQEAIFRWRALPDLPGPLGRHVHGALSGAYVGADDGALIVAGGAAGGTDTSTPILADLVVDVRRAVSALVADASGQAARTLEGRAVDEARYRWYTGVDLPAAAAYGASVSTGRGLVCLGGCNEAGGLRDVLALTWNGRKRRVEIAELPPLPEPRAFAAAAAIGSKVYLVGGVKDPADREASNALWSLDLASLDAGADAEAPAWRRLAAFPGPGRVLPLLVAQHNGRRTLLYLLGGRAAGRLGKPAAEAYSFDPAEGDGRGQWRRIADFPLPGAAASACACGPAHIVAFPPRMSEQANAAQLYHTITNTWVAMAAAPASGSLDVRPSAAARWGDDCVVVGTSGLGAPRLWRLSLRRPTTRFGPWSWSALIAYLLVLVAMGVYFSRREKTTDDFFLGGRRVPWWAAGLSIFGTALSAITFMSFPAKAYATDWLFALCTLVPILVVPLVVAFYIPFYRRLRVTTAYEYLERRFNLAVRLVGSLTFIGFQLGRMTFVLFLPALALATVTGTSVYVCIAIMAVLCTLYTVLGGIEAVIWTDVVQVAILMGAAVASLALVAGGVEGGLGGAIAQAQAAGKLRMVSLSWDVTTAALWVVVVGTLFSSLLPFTADQTVVQRYLTVRDEKSAGRALWLSALGGIPIVILFYGLGTALWAFYKANPGRLQPALKADAIYPLFVARQMHPLVSGLVVAGIFAAGMSSIDSSMNSVSAAVVTDFYRRLRPQASDRRCLGLARWVTMALGVLAAATACLFAAFARRQVLDAYLEVFGLFGGVLAALFALGIFTRRANGAGALVGAAVATVVLFCVRQYTPVHFLIYPAIGVSVCFAAGYLASVGIGGRRKPLRGLTVHTMNAAGEAPGRDS